MANIVIAADVANPDGVLPVVNDAQHGRDGRRADGPEEEVLAVAIAVAQIEEAE